MTGQCQVCGKELPLRRDGTMRHHQALLTSLPCSGSRKVPGGHVHVCACGARWDEEVYG